MREYFDTYTLDENQMKRADINFDQIVNQYDYVLIKRHYFNTYKLLGN